MKGRIEYSDHRNVRSQYSARALDPGDRSWIVERCEFGQTIDCGHHVVVDHDRLSKLLTSMNHSVPNRVNVEMSSFKPARFLQHLHHTPDRFGMGRDRTCSSGQPFSRRDGASASPQGRCLRRILHNDC